MDNIVISGKPGIIIKCGSNFTINNTEYKKGQIICCINDCDTDFIYSKVSKDMTRGANRLGYFEDLELSGLNIKNVPFNRMLNSMVFNSINSTTNKPSLIRQSTDSNNAIAIPVNAINIQAFTDSMAEAEFTNVNNVLMFENAGVYRIYYETPLSACYSIKASPSPLPYFEILIVGSGNNIKEDIKTPFTQIIHINKASLRLDPFIRFNNGIESFDMNFNIISSSEDKIYYGN